MLKHCPVMVGVDNHKSLQDYKEFFAGLYLNAQPQIIARLQTYFEKRTWALISVSVLK